VRHHERIELSDTPISAIEKISEGNPGAVSACMEMAMANPTVDPQSMLGAVAPLLSLDTHAIYGPRIWMLFSDVCNRRADVALACLRWVQLGLGSIAALNHAIDNRGDGLDIEEVMAAVVKRLPTFTPIVQEPAALPQGEV